MYRKKIAAIIVFGLIMTTCSTPANGQVTREEVLSYTMNPIAKQEMIKLFNKADARKELLRKQAIEQLRLTNNAKSINKAIKKLNKTVGRTWYVFSGNTPSGWDCSGLVMWFYEGLNIDLEHRASKQATAGEKVTDPKPGDIVVYKYKGYSSAYHVGIYIGNGQMIHAPNKGQVTRIQPVEDFGGNYSKISYVRLIDSNLD